MHRTFLQEGGSNTVILVGNTVGLFEEGGYVTQIERLICGRLSEQASKQEGREASRQQAGNIINHQDHTKTHRILFIIHPLSPKPQTQTDQGEQLNIKF